MLIALSTRGENLEAEVDPRFGRAETFLLVDSDTLSFEVIKNSQAYDLPQGAGIQAAQNVLTRKPQVLLTGNCGPKAFRVLEAAGVAVVVGVKGTARNAVKDYLEGKFQPGKEANVEGHWV